MSLGATDKVLVRTILEHPHDYAWTFQDIGLRLDERREHRLHVWVPDRCVGTPPIHDHSFDFVSKVVVGEVVNARYEENPAGAKYLRERILARPTSRKRSGRLRPIVGAPWRCGPK